MTERDILFQLDSFTVVNQFVKPLTHLSLGPPVKRDEIHCL
jgi:hypothetical protein